MAHTDKKQRFHSAFEAIADGDDDSGDAGIYDHRVGTGMKSCRDAGNSPGTPFRSVCTERGAYSR